jgi:hypothetical protein
MRDLFDDHKEPNQPPKPPEADRLFDYLVKHYLVSSIQCKFIRDGFPPYWQVKAVPLIEGHLQKTLFGILRHENKMPLGPERKILKQRRFNLTAPILLGRLDKCLYMMDNATKPLCFPQIDRLSRNVNHDFIYPQKFTHL